MINPDAMDQQLEDLRALLREKLSLRGQSFEAQLRKAGRLLPRRVHQAGRVLTEARTRAAHPKLARLSDPQRLVQAITTIRDHLEQIDPVERRKTQILHWVAGLVFNFVILAVLIVVIMRWQGSM